jgi:hypothetical protein
VVTRMTEAPGNAPYVKLEIRSKRDLCSYVLGEHWWYTIMRPDAQDGAATLFTFCWSERAARRRALRILRREWRARREIIVELGQWDLQESGYYKRQDHRDIGVGLLQSDPSTATQVIPTYSSVDDGKY